MPVRIKVKQSGRIQSPKLDNGQLTAIGNAMVAAQKDRWSKAINASGNSAKPLSKKYFFIKRRITHQNSPKRDYNLTGLLLKNFTLRKAINNQIRAEPTSRQARKEAQAAEQYEEMIGFAGTDQNAVFRESQAQYGQYLKKAWVPIRG